MTTYKPDDYTSVAPYLIVNGAAATIQFLVLAFDAVALREFPTADGRIMHAEVRIDDTVLMLADSPNGQSAVPANVHVYVPDVDTTYNRAIEAGAASVQAPEDKDDGDRRGGVQDAGGTIWWIATKLA